MKRILLILVLGMFFSLTFVSAGLDCDGAYIRGIVKDSNFNSLSHANVTVTCGGSVISTISNSEGFYYTCHPLSECGGGDIISVFAQKGDKFGMSEPRALKESLNEIINFRVLNSTVPEFGGIMLILTLFSSIGVFYFIRR